jgi:tetratricopeptide (TPR) repeat protein
MAQAARGDYLAAIASFEESIATVPDAPWSYIALSHVFIESGEPGRAATALRGALECTPAKAVALRESIADGLRAVGELETAIDVFGEVLAEAPGRSTAAVGLARTLLRRADELRSEAGHLLADVADLELDEQLLQSAIDAAPRVPGLYRQLGKALLRRGDRTRAIAVLRVGLAHDPDDPDALALLAIAIADESEVDQPLEDEPDHHLELVERALTIDPDNADLLVRRARLLGRDGATVAAVEAWRAVVAREPDESLWHRELGDRLAEAGDFEAAGAAYDRAVALGFDVY